MGNRVQYTNQDVKSLEDLFYEDLREARPLFYNYPGKNPHKDLKYLIHVETTDPFCLTMAFKIPFEDLPLYATEDDDSKYGKTAVTIAKWRLKIGK